MRGILVVSVFLIGQIVHAQNAPRYSCLLDRTDVEIWISDTLHSFDDNGILKQADDYHPVSICQYGLLCLDKFESTGDSLWLKRAANQVSFFTDSSHVHELFNGKGIGLPYNFAYKGLEPPWYSGMAQGMAISFLLRYSDVTKINSIRGVIEQIAFVLTQPQELGGCLSRNPENLLWIEEYPNSTQSPQVLNGAIFDFLV